jgi:hypothetical protein
MPVMYVGEMGMTMHGLFVEVLVRLWLSQGTSVFMLMVCIMSMTVRVGDNFMNLHIHSLEEVIQVQLRAVVSHITPDNPARFSADSGYRVSEWLLSGQRWRSSRTQRRCGKR